jgi:AcrR family transcriptional regulator
VAVCFAVAVKGTRQERAAATRQRLLEVAVHQFAARSYNDVAVSDITDGAGVAHGVVFHHFGNKRGVYLAAVREISHRLFELRTPDPSAQPRDQIREVLREHFNRMSDNEDLLRGYLQGSPALAADAEAWDALEHHRMGMVIWTSTAVGLDPDNDALRLMLRAAGDAMDQLSLRWLQQGRGFPVDDLAEAMVRMVVGALWAARALDPALDVEPAAALLS